MTPTAEPAQGDHRATYREVLAEPRFRLIFSTRAVAITAGSLRITTFSADHHVLGTGLRGHRLRAVERIRLRHRLSPAVVRLAAAGLTGRPTAAPRAHRRRLRLGVRRRPAARPGADADRGKPRCRGAGRPRHTGVRWRVESAGRAVVEGRRLCTGPFTEQHRLLWRAIVRSGAGRWVVAVLGPRRALAVSAALYLGCALAVRIRLPRLEPGEFGGTPGSARGDGGAVRASLHGAGLLLRGHTVRRLMLAQWLPPAFVAGAEGLIIAYAGGRHFAPGWYAVLMGCLPVGMLVGDLLVGRWLRPPTRERLVLVVPLIALTGLPLVGFATEPGVGVSSRPVCCCSAASDWPTVSACNGRSWTPCRRMARARARSFGLLGSGSMTLQGVGPACFGSVAAGIATGGAIALAGGAAVLTAGWILTWHPSTSPVPVPNCSTGSENGTEQHAAVLLRGNRRRPGRPRAVTHPTPTAL